jgi:hypothetical protein
VLATSALVLALSGCGGGDGAEQAAASPTPVAAVGPQSGSGGVDPFEDPPCDEPADEDDLDSPGVRKTAEALRELGEEDYGDDYAGLVPCVTEDRVFVYAVDGGSKPFRKAAAKIAKKNKVTLKWKDAAFSRDDADAARRAVLERFDDLDRAGAPFANVLATENGTLKVSVRSDVTAAERVLSALLDRIYVVLAPAPEFAPTAPPDEQD